MIDGVYVLGTAAIVLLSLLSTRMLVGHFWCYYGRQTLISWIGLGFILGMLRVLYACGFISTDTNRAYNSIAFVVALVHVSQTIFLHHLAHREVP